MAAHPKSVAILLAAGSGKRMKGAVTDKVLETVAGKALIAHSVNAFAQSGMVQNVIFVCRDEEQIEAIRSTIPGAASVEFTFTLGGAERRDSVWAGLLACPADTEIVLIHDTARPCLQAKAIEESIEKAQEIGAACLARPVTDTIKSADTYDGGFLTTTVDRQKLWAMETPQTFRYPLIKDAYADVIASGAAITDDLSAIEDLDQAVAFIDNRSPNPKLTTPADLAYIRFLLEAESQS